tara:strand:+ start:1521 stop:2015 length:495 start_codon:yes stop_codon:yes gene_type:complete
MKKIFYLIFILVTFILISQCADYKPIFSTTDLQFKIVDHKIKGDKSLGNRLYSKLHFLSKSKNDEQNITNIVLILDVQKTKSPTSKDSSGKILGYKINLNTKLEAIDYVTNKSILEQDFNSSSNYKIQSRYSESLALEGKTINDLIEKTYQDILFNLFQNIKSK